LFPADLYNFPTFAMEKTPNVDEKVAASLSSLEESNGAIVAIHIDPEQEKAVLRKFDKYLLPQAFLFILFNFLDRSNLGMFNSFKQMIVPNSI
jgi:hypothetical protein